MRKMLRSTFLLAALYKRFCGESLGMRGRVGELSYLTTAYKGWGGNQIALVGSYRAFTFF